MNKGFLALTLAISFLFSTIAVAQTKSPNCFPREDFIEGVTKNNFSLEARGLSADGSVIEIYTDDGGRFVLVRNIANQPPKAPSIISCRVTNGLYWFDYKPKMQSKPEPKGKQG